MLNRNYGKLRDDARIIYAPSEVKVGNTYYPAPTAEQYAACGYLPIDSTKPEKDGAYFVSTEYGDLVDGRIVRRYDERTIAAPPPRIFSKLYLILALQKRGLYEQFKVMLASAGLEDMWIAANELNEGYGGFDSFVAQAKTALGLTDAEVEEILGEAVAR